MADSEDSWRNDAEAEKLITAIRDDPVVEFPIPRRGDPVAAYLKRWRDKFEKSHGYYHMLDRLLDDYRLHADTGRPLHEDVVEGDEGP